MDEDISTVKANESLGETLQTALVSFAISNFNLAIISREDVVEEDERRPCFALWDEPYHYIKVVKSGEICLLDSESIDVV